MTISNLQMKQKLYKSTTIEPSLPIVNVFCNLRQQKSNTNLLNWYNIITKVGVSLDLNYKKIMLNIAIKTWAPLWWKVKYKTTSTKVLQVKLAVTRTLNILSRISNQQVKVLSHLHFGKVTAREQVIIFSKVDMSHNETTSSGAILHINHHSQILYHHIV